MLGDLLCLNAKKVVKDGECKGVARRLGSHLKLVFNTLQLFCYHMDSALLLVFLDLMGNGPIWITMTRMSKVKF